MFAYCNNNPVNSIDICGNDAIWIQEAGSAYGMGHTGLMLQDKEGDWHYFYWGPENEDISAVAGWVPSRMIIEKVDDLGRDLSYHYNVIVAIQNSGNPFISDRARKTTETLYFQGDYTASLEWLEELQDQQKAFPIAAEYHLIMNNCVQKSYEALSKSNPAFGSFHHIIPNHAVIKARTIEHVIHSHNYAWNLPSKTHNYNAVA